MIRSVPTENKRSSARLSEDEAKTARMMAGSTAITENRATIRKMEASAGGLTAPRLEQLDELPADDGDQRRQQNDIGGHHPDDDVVGGENGREARQDPGRSQLETMASRTTAKPRCEARPLVRVNAACGAPRTRLEGTSSKQL